MKVISYSLSEDRSKISLFIHAPNVLGRIKDLAQELGVSWPKEGNPESAVELARIIDEINLKFDEIRTKNLQDYEEIMKIGGKGGYIVAYDYKWVLCEKGKGVLKITLNQPGTRSVAVSVRS